MARTAPNKELYRAAWQHHITELAALALAADIPYHEYREVRDTLTRWLNLAIENDFPNSETKV